MVAPIKSRTRNASLKKKILVVDDNADAAELVSGLLELQGHHVRSAHTPDEAIAIASEFEPEVAFLDLGLPVMDGFQLATELQRLPQLHGCRYIAITGYDDADDRRHSKRAGFAAHLLKPISMDTLESVLSEKPPRARAQSRN